MKRRSDFLSNLLADDQNGGWLKSADLSTGFGLYEPGPTTYCAEGNFLPLRLSQEEQPHSTAWHPTPPGGPCILGRMGMEDPAGTDRVPRALAECGPEDPLCGAARVPWQCAEAAFLLVIL